MAAAAAATAATVLLDLHLKPKPSSVLFFRPIVCLPAPTARFYSQSSLLRPNLRSASAPRRWRFAAQDVAVDESAEKTDEGSERDGAVEEEEKRRKLYVANAPWSFSAPDLAKLFSECGTVKDVEMIKQTNGQSKGFAFITMATGEEARAAVDKFDSHELDGRIIRVEFSKSFKKPPPPPGSIAVDQRCQIYVSNLAWKARSVHLREFFSGKFNPISARVVFESPTGRSSGYGFVAFATKEEAEAAISELDGKELLGRPLRLRLSQRSDALSDREPEALNSGELSDGP